MSKKRVRRVYTNTTRRVHDPVRIRVSPSFRPSLPVRREVPFFSPEVPYRDYSSLSARSVPSVRPVRRPRPASRSVAGPRVSVDLYRPGQVRVGGYVLPTVCARRAVRSRVIHAIGAAGGRVRPPRYTEQSSVRC